MENDWLQNIDVNDLAYHAPELSLNILYPDYPLELEKISSSMVKGGHLYYATRKKEGFILGEDPRPPEEYWIKFKKEFYEFLCTDSHKYNELREKLKKSGNQTSTVISAISAYLAKILGLRDVH